MTLSFYSSAINAAAQQEKLNVISNNMANINTYGFKSGSTEFTDLYYQNIRSGKEAENSTAKSGAGVRIQQVNTNFSTAGIMSTGEPLDFYIGGSGFFALQNPNTLEKSYTKDGSFYAAEAADGKFYLTHKASGGRVLDSKGLPITMKSVNDTFDVGIYDFANLEGFTSNGGNAYTAGIKSGNPILVTNLKPEPGKLEMSNVDLSTEMSRMITAQRSYQMNLKMLQVSDEIIQDVNRYR